MSKIKYFLALTFISLGLFYINCGDDDTNPITTFTTTVETQSTETATETSSTTEETTTTSTESTTETTTSTTTTTTQQYDCCWMNYTLQTMNSYATWSVENTSSTDCILKGTNSSEYYNGGLRLKDLVLSDFTLEMNLRQNNGVTTYPIEISIREDYTAQNSYSLGVWSDGYWSLAKYVNGSYTDINSAGAVATINAPFNKQFGDTNKIKLEVIGSQISVYFNDVLEETITDSSYANGYLGFWLPFTDPGNPAQDVDFFNLSIY